MKKRKLWIPITAAAVAAAAIAAALLAPRFLQPEPVPVYAVNMVGYTDYYTGTSESYGMVTTDRVQTAFVSDTQTITEILVYEGQQVKKGDVLYTYDTTLSDLALERKDLAVQQLEVTLKTAQEELKALKNMKPIVYKEDTATNRSKYAKSPSDKGKLGTVYSTGTTGLIKSSPLYYWIEHSSGVTSAQISPDLIEYLFGQSKNPNATTIYVVFQSVKGNQTNTEYDQQYGVCFTRTYKEVPVETEPTETDPPETDPPETEPPETDPPVTEPPETEPPVTEPPITEPPVTEPPETEPPVTEPPETETPGTQEPAPEDPGAGEPTEPGEEAPAASAAVHTLANPSQSTQTAAKPQTEKEFAGYAISFFEPSSVDKDNSSIDWNSGYTSAELAALRTEKQAEITQLQFDIKMGKAELKIMKQEADSGQVLAQFDGAVTGITDPLVAAEQDTPLMKVIGGGGYYVEGTVSELELSRVALGQTITVNSWDTGAVLEGTVVEVGTYPSADAGYGDTSVSYYPYKVFIDQTADLMEGSYVSLTIPSEASETGTLYVQNAFLRKDGSRTYVYVRSGEGLLEQRYLEVGVSQDGYMTPVYGGLEETDFIAFPYGSDLKDGVPTYEGTMDELYGY